MSSVKPQVIMYHYIDNIQDNNAELIAMGQEKFGDKFKGFIKETSWVHSDGYVSRKAEPIECTPAQSFRKAIEDAWLVGFQF